MVMNLDKPDAFFCQSFRSVAEKIDDYKVDLPPHK
jgi:hypothetical protein